MLSLLASVFFKSMQPKALQVFKVIHHKILVDFGLTDHFATRHALIQFELPKERLHCIYAQVHKAVAIAPLVLVIKDNLFLAFSRVLSGSEEFVRPQTPFGQGALEQVGVLKNHHSRLITSASAKELILL